MIPAHAESLMQIRTLLDCIVFQRAPGWRLNNLFLCSDSEEIQDAFSDLSSVRFISQDHGRGKPDALNKMMLRSTAHYCIEISADCLPASEHTFKYILEPLRSPEVAAVTSRPEPYKPGFMWLPNVVWKCHHFVQPKLNAEMFSFKKEFVDPLPETIVHDDAFIHRMIVKKHCTVCYEPRAVVFNSCPKTLSEFYQQRKKNVIGNLQLGQEFQEMAPAMMRLRSLIVMSMEVLANLHGRLDYVRGKIPKGLIGYSLKSTKEVHK
jgi:hypothetical protein